MFNKKINNKVNEHLDTDYALSITPYHMPSICIPRVFPNIDEKRICHIFNDLNIGLIMSIDFVGRQAPNGDKYNLVYIHFDGWYRNENADKVRMKLLTGNEVKIIYDDPWFWKVSGLKEHQITQKAEPEPDNAYKKEIKRATFQFDEEPIHHYQEQRHHYEDFRPRHHYEDFRPRPNEDFRPRPNQKRRDVSRERERPQEPIRQPKSYEHKEPVKPVKKLALAPRLDNVPIPKPVHAFIPRQIQIRNKKQELEPTSPVTPPPKRKIYKKEVANEEKEDGEL